MEETKKLIDELRKELNNIKQELSKIKKTLLNHRHDGHGFPIIDSN